MVGVQNMPIGPQADGELSGIIPDRHRRASIRTHRRYTVDLFDENISGDPSAFVQRKSPTEPFADISNIRQHQRAEHCFETQKGVHGSRDLSQDPEQLQADDSFSVIQHVAGLLMNRLQQLTRVLTVPFATRDKCIADNIRCRHIFMQAGSHAERHGNANPSPSEKKTAAPVPVSDLKDHLSHKQIVYGNILLSGHSTKGSMSRFRQDCTVDRHVRVASLIL